MCPHIWIKINDVTVCKRCGLTRLADGRVFFDRKIVNYRANNKKGGKT